MNNLKRFICLLLVTIISVTCTVSAQNTFSSEEELKKQAAKLFDEDNFEEAYPLYSQLTSIYPKDPNYNYRVGVCMLYASDDKEKPIAFLEFAMRFPDVDKEVFFYLAKAYHLNYRFDDAIKQYQQYQKNASGAQAEKLMVERQIEMCKNGKRLLRSLSDLIVIDKKEVNRSDFFRSYDISGIGGKLLIKPDESAFKTAIDKKKKETSIIYLATNNSQVFFSSYGSSTERGKDIYIITKSASGSWTNSQTLGYPINTEYDEDYPFLHPNGKVLYFCSKGHNSMGGYDIFKSTLNEETNTWNKPVNLDFPINTPDDDILYVTNEDEKEAFFASARGSKGGQTAVYHINAERKPVDALIIKGAIVKNRDNQALDIKITVKDLNDNVIVGIFNARPSDGMYLINIPNGGKFVYTVEATGFTTQSDVVEVPAQLTFKPMKQEISYELGTDKLIIKNLFDEPVDDESYLLALNFIREKSKMDVTTNTPVEANESASGDDVNTAKNNQATNKAKLSNDDIVKIGYADAEEVAQEAVDLSEQANVALVLANQKNELALNKAKEAAQLMSDASKMTDNAKKQATINEANEISKEADELNQETVAAFNLAKKIEQRAAAKEQEAELSMQYAKDLEAAVKSKSSDANLFARLDEQQKKLDELAERNDNPTLANSLKMDMDNKKRELDKAIQASNDIKQEIVDNKALMQTTQAEADKEKNSKVKQGLLDQVEGLKMDTQESEKELVVVEQKVERLQNEYNGAANEASLVSSVYSQAKTVSNEKAAADVAMVDKAKLEQQVNNIKSTPPSTNNSVAGDTKKASELGRDKPTSTSTTTSTANTNIDGSSGKTGKTDSTAIAATKASETDATKTGSTQNNTSGLNEGYAKKYSNDIEVANTITNDLERETQKAALYKAWTASISEDLAAKQVALKSEKNKNTQKSLNAEIATLEKELKEKQEVGNATVVTVEKLKQQETIATNTSDLKEDYATKYSTEISKTNSITNDLDRENKKAELYKAWTSTINEDIAAKQVALKSEKNKNEQNTLNAEIATLEKELKEKQEATKAAEVNAEKLKQQETIATNTAGKKVEDATAGNQAVPKSNEVGGTKTSATTTQGNNKGVVNTNIASPEGKFEYTSPVAAEQATKAAELNRQADDLLTQSNQLKTEAASEKNVAVKKATNEKSIALEKQAESKQLEAAQGIAVANKEEYVNNQKKLDQLMLATKGNSNTDIVQAGKVKGEAEAYFNKAQQGREAANKSIDFKVKEAAIAEAFKNEIIALEKQKEADAIYSKYASIAGPEFSTTPGQNAAAVETKTIDNAAAVKPKDEITSNTTNVVDNNLGKDNIVTSQSSNITSISDLEKEKDLYTVAYASEKATKAIELNKEANDLLTQSENLKTKANSEQNLASKNAIYAESEELIKQAENKKLEASQTIALANKAEYTNNQNKLDQLAIATKGNSADDIISAEMMQEESVIFFNRAQQAREEADKSTSFYVKEATLEEALKNEMIALEKQKTATTVYLKYTSGLTSSTTKVSDKKSDTKTPETKANNAAVLEKESKTNADNLAKNNSTSEVTKQTNLEATKQATENKEITKVDTSSSSTTKTDVVRAVEPTSIGSQGVTQEFEYTSAVASEQAAKAAELKKEASYLTFQSSDLQLKANSEQNSTAKNTMLIKSEDLKHQAESKQLEAAQAIAIANKTEYTDNQNKLEQLTIATKTSTAPEVLMAEIKKDESITYFDRAQKSRDVASKATNFNEKEIALADALKNEVIALEKQKEANTLYSKYTPGSAAPAATITDSQTNPTAGGTGDVKTNEIAKTPTDKTAPVNDATKEIKTETIAPPSLIKEEQPVVFVSKLKPAYTPSKPIPVNEKLPEGLVFKVQIGAFRNPIPQDLFSGMSPVTAETTPQGFIRYTAGLFVSYANADKAKEEVRAMGYKDAFVVGFYNGKRIAMGEATTIMNEKESVITTKPIEEIVKESSGNLTENNINSETKSAIKDAVIAITHQSTTNTNTVQSNSKSNVPVKSVDVTTVGGLFYTIQVGVFSQEVSPSKLHNVQPLYSEKTTAGNIRYTTGIYNNIPRATEAKNLVVDGGIKDAYITAYFNGKRITMPEVIKLVQSSAPYATSPNMNALPTFSSKQLSITPLSQENISKSSSENTSLNVANNKQQEKNVQKNLSANPIDSTTGVIFKVQIGAFREEVPLEIANKFLKISKMGVKNYVNENGLTVYTVGAFRTYEEANAAKLDVASVADITDAFVVAYKDGGKISVEEARKMMSK